MSVNKKGINYIQPENNNVVATNLNYLKTVSENNDIQVMRNIMLKSMNISQNQKILDVGCGAGEVALDIGKMVGPNGLVIGIDANEDAINTANKKDSDFKNVKFLVQNAEHIEYPDSYFDSSRSERVFQHLKDPDKVFDEMIRVTKNNSGKITVMDPDWDTLTINSLNTKVTRMVVHQNSDNMTHGQSGRFLLSMFKQRNLKEIGLQPYVVPVNNLNLAKIYVDLELAVETLVKKKKITDEEAKLWWNELEENDKKGLFYLTLTLFIVSGKK